MPSKAAALWAHYVVLDSDSKPLAGETVAQHLLIWSKDGTHAAATNVGVGGNHLEVHGGLYKILLTAAETDCNCGGLCGTLTTAGAVIVPVSYTFELLPPTGISTAITTGNWGTAGTWAGGAVPAAGDNIIIRTGVTVTIAADLDLGTFGTLELQGTAAIEIAADKTVATVPAGWTIYYNYGTITDNYGLVQQSETPGSIVTNRATIDFQDGTLGVNSGVIGRNYGTTGNNEAVGTIKLNTGTVTNNNGEVVINDATGVVTSSILLTRLNRGTITNNTGVVEENTGTVAENYSGGKILSNTGIVTLNDSGGKVFGNVGTVTTNNGSVYSEQISAAAALAAYNTTGVAKEATLTTIHGHVDDILADTNELELDWKNGGRLDLLLDAVVAGAGVGSGGAETEFTVQVGGVAVEGAEVWVTSDLAGLTVIAGPLTSDVLGKVTFMLETASGPFYVKCQHGSGTFTSTTITWNAGTGAYQ